MMRRKLHFLFFRVSYGRLLAVFVFFLLCTLILLDRPKHRFTFMHNIHQYYDDYFMPVFNTVSAPVRLFFGFTKGIQDYFNTVSENRKLRLEIAELKNWKAISEVQSRQLKAYQTVFTSFSEILGTRIIARGITETSGPFVRSLLIDAGAKQGIEKEYAVMDSHGLLGRVITVGRRSSRVLLLSDLNSRIPVMTDDGLVRAIMVGDNSLNPKLRYIDSEAKLEQGMKLVTSGDEGILPKGLGIGKILKHRKKPDQTEWSVQLFSGERPGNIIWVYPYKIPERPESEGLTDHSSEPEKAE